MQQTDLSVLDQSEMGRKRWTDAPKQPKMNDFKTAIYHKNTIVDNLLSFIVPTEAQKAKRAQQKVEQEAAEKERIEKERLERNRKSKIALSKKQKMHALRLYRELGGIITRREIENTSLKAHEMTQRTKK